MLIPADVSLDRRGNHALVIDGKTQFFLESKNENLGAYEGQTVSVSGNLEGNVKAEDLPVLVVTSIKTAHGHEPLHSWDVPALDLRIKAPETWQAKIKDGIVSFSLSGETAPLLSITQVSQTGSLPSGTATYIAGRRGIRTTPERSTTQEIFIQEQDRIIRLQLDIPSQQSIKTVEEGQILLAQFENVLASLKFLSDQSSSAPATGTGAGTPCGGTAGILCASGYFCDISDPIERIGICRQR